MKNNSNTIFAIKGVVQNYSWGGKTFIPRLLNIGNSENKPHAEYWLGAHENASAIIDAETKLAAAISSNPALILGEGVAKLFGRLPYLLKVLDVREMLSIQVHPSKEDAIKGYEEENEKGIPKDSPTRNYKDDNHKPELMVALSDFWLLHGFKPADELHSVFSTTEELFFLKDIFINGGYQEVYKTLMELSQQDVNEKLEPLLSRIVPKYESGELPKDSADFWAARAAQTFNQPGKIDRGIFSIYLFNVVFLSTGQAIFQDAGIPHAYLEGQNMEIMANSDNVLRGGLTTKHVDVAELMKHVKYQPTIPAIISGTPIDEYQSVFLSPARDFELSLIKIADGETCSIQSRTAEIYFVEDGSAEFTSGEVRVTRHTGESLLASYGASLNITGLSPSRIYRASVPANIGE